MLRSRDEADSAAQDTFIKAYRALVRQKKDAIEEPAKWLTRVAVNTCLDRLRSRRWAFWQRRISQDDEQVILQSARESGPNQEDELLAAEIMKRLNLALERLSLRQRSIFLLRHEEGYTLEEIGEILKLDVGTVKAHMARAVQKLREELRDLYGVQTPNRFDSAT
jgi:RNA polymerase sigma-70 factor (ECF subfamily)